MNALSLHRHTFVVFFLLLFSFLISCSSEAQKPEQSTKGEGTVSSTESSDNKTVSSPEDVNIDRFESLIAQEGMQILDVRTPSEIAQGYVAGAAFINIHDPEFETKAAEMLKKDQPLTIYCKSGGRSAMASSKLHNLGFQNIYNYTGGMSEWYGLNKPTQKD